MPFTDIPRIQGGCEARIVPLSVLGNGRAYAGKKRSKLALGAARTLTRTAFACAKAYLSPHRLPHVTPAPLMPVPASATPGDQRKDFGELGRGL